ncbi:hypothetical protein IKF92_01035 [Candidatus Saccharibacteria bacterium]|nr:hypothetical protein [Candidatus Saccharibacteria bacterium]
MTQAKKKTATKTTKKATANRCRKAACTRTNRGKKANDQDRMHIYIITVMGMIAGLLLCANAAMLMV